MNMEVSFWNSSIVLMIIALTIIWIRSRRPPDMPPGPWTLPFIGNLITFSRGDLIAVANYCRGIYGNLFSLSIGPHWIIFVNGYEALREVFVRQGDNFSDRPDVYYGRYIKRLKGIAFAQPWKKQRLFTLNLLNGFGFTNRSIESTITEEAVHFVEVLRKEAGKPLCIQGPINKAVSNVICSIVFGSRFEYEDEEFGRFVHAITKTSVNKYIPKINLLPALRYLPPIWKAVRHCEQENDKLREWFQIHIEQHKKTLDENNIRDFIDAFLVEITKYQHESNSQFTEENLQYIITDLFSAGTETTATTILWGVLCLVNYPQVQKRLRREIFENCPLRPPSLNDKNDLHFCQAVIAEVQRLGFIIPMGLPHTASTDADVYGYRIPKGAIVVPNLMSVGYDEEVFPEPHKFDPERFLDKDGKFYGKDKILPFSIGQRICPGAALARNEIFIFFTSILYHYEILPPEGQEPAPMKGRLGITYGPVPFQVRFKEHLM